MGAKASVRNQIEAISGVSRTWFEWSGAELPEKILVVEVDFDTDPNAPTFRKHVIQAVEQTLHNALLEHLPGGDERTVIIGGLRIVPRH